MTARACAEGAFYNVLINLQGLEASDFTRETREQAEAFLTEARCRKSVTLDLRQSEARDLFLRLVEKSDVLIENFRPETMEEWGMSWDVLREANEGLILLRVSGYGQTGPYADEGADELRAYQLAVQHLNGEGDGGMLNTIKPFSVQTRYIMSLAIWLRIKFKPYPVDQSFSIPFCHHAIFH